MTMRNSVPGSPKRPPADQPLQFGIRFETELQAFRAAQSMAEELSEWRPTLGGNTWVALTQDGSEGIYCVGVNRRSGR